jgi:D-tyrosyl-tRNA(Tyr) deacylase
LRALVQRVSRACVRVDGDIVGEVGRGFLVLLGVRRGDGAADAAYLADKVANLRVFGDEGGRMNRSLLEVGGGVLAVSQFTLYADTARGRRPGFELAAPPEEAEPLYRAFCDALVDQGVEVGQGIFGAHMDVELTNDGPVTIMLESKSG